MHDNQSICTLCFDITFRQKHTSNIGRIIMKIIHLDHYYTVDILTIHMQTGICTVHVDMYVLTVYRDSHPLVFAHNTFLLVYLDNTCCQVNIIYTFRQMHPDIFRDTTLKRSERLHYSAAALKLRLDRPCTCPHLSSPGLTSPSSRATLTATNPFIASLRDLESSL